MKGIDLEQMTQAADSATTFLKALANEARLMVLCQLVEGEKSVGDLQARLDIGQSALSQHLARLREDDLVQTRREAQTIFYSLKGDRASRILEVLYELYCAPKVER